MAQLRTFFMHIKQLLLFPIFRDWGAGRLRRENFEGAIVDCSRAIALKPDEPAPYLTRGTAYHRLGKVAQAQQDYEAALQRDTHLSSAHINLGNLFYDTGDYSDAIRHYNLAIFHEPDSATAYYNRGLVATAQGQYINAVADYTQALRLKPTYGFVYGNRGEVNFLLGRYEDAMNDFIQAHYLSPLMRRAVAGMAVAQHALGQTMESVQLWEHLLERNESYDDASWVQAEHNWDVLLTDEVRGLLADLHTNR